MRGALLAACLACAAGASAGDFQRGAVGTTGSEFLTHDVGARGIALGGAYSALSNDAYSLYWNPAGLAHIPRFSAGFMYTRYVADITHQAAHFAGRVNDAGVLAGGMRYRDFGKITHTNLAGNSLGSFQPRDYVAEMGWGQSVLDLSDSEMDVMMGVAGRWLHSDYLRHADSFSGDIGIQSRFYTSRHTYDLSFVAQNLGQGQKFDRIRDSLPVRGRLGAAVSPFKTLTMAIEAIMPINDIVQGAAGVEYVLEASREVKGAFRAGFNTTAFDSLGLSGAVSAGMGLTLGNLSFDYAFVPMGILGTDTHRFSITFNLPAKASRRYRER
jgi:hypothetical protein